MRRISADAVVMAVTFLAAEVMAQDQRDNIDGRVDHMHNELAPLWADRATLKCKGDEYPHYRAGGAPLYDTGRLYESIFGNFDMDGAMTGVLAGISASSSRGTAWTTAIPYALDHKFGYMVERNPIPWVRNPDPNNKCHWKYMKKAHAVPARNVFSMTLGFTRRLFGALQRAVGN